MSNRSTRGARALLGGTIALALALSPALGTAAESWNFTDTSSSSCTASGNLGGNSSSDGDCAPSTEREWRTYQSSGDKVVTLSGWSTTGSGGSFKDAYTKVWSGGVGVRNDNEGTGSPAHSIDNLGATDFVLLEFSGDWALTTVSSGWALEESWGDSYDSPDFDVFYWSGDDSVIDNASNLIEGQNFDTLGWDLLGRYEFEEGYDLQTVTVQSVSQSDPGVSAKYWLVAASASSPYNKAEDFFKLAGVGGDQVNPPPPPPPGEPGVPEPASLLLLAAGLPFLRQRHLASRAV